MVLGVEVDDAAASGTTEASRLSESVVLRVKTTTSDSRALTNSATVSRACS